MRLEGFQFVEGKYITIFYHERQACSWIYTMLNEQLHQIVNRVVNVQLLVLVANRLGV